MKKIKEINNKILLTLLYGLILLVFWYFDIPCLFKHFFGIDCIGCGMTRAILSALKFDFKAAFTYHSMFWSMPLLYIYFLFDGRVIGKKSFDIVVLSSVLIGFLLNWGIKFV